MDTAHTEMYLRVHFRQIVWLAPAGNRLALERGGEFLLEPGGKRFALPLCWRWLAFPRDPSNCQSSRTC